jgi:hypothetical protein
VILAGYLDPPRVQVPYRVVGAVVPEGHLVRLAAQSEAEQLVPEADAEDRDLAEERAQRAHGVFESRRVSRPVGEEDAVGFRGEYLLRARRAGHSQHGGAPAP